MTSTNDSTEVKRRINPAQYRELGSFADALRLAEEQYGNIEAASAAIGDGFELLAKEQKVQLVGVPLVLLSWSFSNGTHGEFVSARAVTEQGRKVVFNDGSTGIRDQLRAYTDETGRDGGLLVKRGLRRSVYDYDDNGTQKEAETYYIDTAA